MVRTTPPRSCPASGLRPRSFALAPATTWSLCCAGLSTAAVTGYGARTRWGGRWPFVLAAAILAVGALAALPAAAGSSLLLVAVFLAVFFVAYFVYYTPYYALFPDLVPEDAHGRSQGFPGLRSAGLLVGLAGGGVLSLWQPLPFLVGAGALVVVTVVLVQGSVGGSPGREASRSRRRM